MMNVNVNVNVNEKRKFLSDILSEVGLLDSLRWEDWKQFHLTIERLYHFMNVNNSDMLSDNVYADIMDICANGETASSDDFATMVSEIEKDVKEELRNLGSAT